MAPIGCQQFDVHVDELALGQLDEPLRGQMLAHAAGCQGCHSLLDGVATVADHLLLAAPQVEPPAGFENRVLDRIAAETSGSHRRPDFKRWIAAGVATVGIVVAGLLVLARIDDGPGLESAAIVATGGIELGTVQLIAEPTPHVLVTIDTPRPDPGTRTCELQRPDGTWDSVGWWDAADIATGVWAVGIDPDLLDATAMRITNDGDVLATATFD